MEWTDYDDDYNDDPWLLRLIGPVLFTTVNHTEYYRSMDHPNPHRGLCTRSKR